jgi:hypothetical protein
MNLVYERCGDDVLTAWKESLADVMGEGGGTQTSTRARLFLERIRLQTDSWGKTRGLMLSCSCSSPLAPGTSRLNLIRKASLFSPSAATPFPAFSFSLLPRLNQFRFDESNGVPSFKFRAR